MESPKQKNMNHGSGVYAFGDCHLPVSVYTGMYDVPKDYFDHLCNHLKTVNPEVLLIAGDLFWGENLDEIKEDLEKLRSLPGKYKIFIEGNHDIWFNQLGTNSELAYQRAYELFSDFDFYYIGGRATSIELHDGRKIGICGSKGYDNNFAKINSTPDYNEIINEQLQNLRGSLQQMQHISETEHTSENICLMHYPPTMQVFSDQRTGNEQQLNLIKQYECINKVICAHVHVDPLVEIYTKTPDLDIYSVVISNTCYESIKII